MAIIGAALTIGVRLTGLILFAPFLGSMAIPARIKAIFVFAVTLLLYPTVGQQIALPSLAGWPILIFTEFLIQKQGDPLRVTTQGREYATFVKVKGHWRYKVRQIKGGTEPPEGWKE